MHTDGEASNPGPNGANRQRRRGPRSQEARNRRRRHEIDTTLLNQQLVILHVNIRGWVTHHTELAARVRLMTVKPAVICVNETFLTKAVQNVKLEGYEIVHRLDRREDKECGGVLMLAATEQAAAITFLAEGGLCDERIWALMHTTHGPHLLCSWYRPPGSGQSEEFVRFETELQEHSAEVMGTVVTGDMNVHNEKWLRLSSETTAAGRQLAAIAASAGLKQQVREPTRDTRCLTWFSAT